MTDQTARDARDFGPDFRDLQDGPPGVGTPEHAASVTEGRHPGVRDGLQWLTYAHLPPALRPFSAPFYVAAVALVQRVTTDSPELTTAINHLIAAKDSAVRAGIRHQTGRAGSIPRPQETVAPPVVTESAPQPFPATPAPADIADGARG